MGLYKGLVMGRKKIAVFTANIYRDMVKETQYGLIQAAKREGVKLLFFSAFSDNFSTFTKYTQFTTYDTGDFAVYYLPDLNEYDGLITMDTYLPDYYLEYITALKKNSPVPVVTLGNEEDYTYNVVNDQEKSLENLIDHLIEVHNCKEIVHVAGRLDLAFAQVRYDVFKNTIRKHGLPLEKRNIVQGNLWYDCGEYVVDQILDDYSHEADRYLPDAIVCANDYSAIGVLQELTKRGISVPEDVIVTGYDNIPETMFTDPTITTSEQPFEQVGKDGVNTLVALWNSKKNGKKIPHTKADPGILKCNQSCGCEPKHVYKKDLLKEEYSKTITRLDELALANTNLLLTTLASETYEDFLRSIEDNCLMDTGFKNAVMCLMTNWNKHVVIKSYEDFKDQEFEVACGMYNGKPIKRGKLPKGHLLPDEMREDPEPYHIVPIHYFEYFMGYFIISPDLENLSQANMKTWFLNISILLDNWNTKQELNSTLEQMRNLYSTDVLTGLYNRRGYGLFFDSFYKECYENHSGLAVFLIDMDNMKHVNDTLGHDEGDYCLCTIGYAMKKAATHGEICIRSGGDEFVVLAKNYNDEMVEEYLTNLRHGIALKRRTDGKAYEISVSIGCYMLTPTEELESNPDASEKYLRFADEEMYIEKKEHKKNKN